MIDSAALQALEEIYALESTSVIRYLSLNSEVQVRDDFDRKVRAFFMDWYRASDINRNAFLDLLESEGRILSTYSYPLKFSEYNYLNARYLLGPVVLLMGQNLDSMSARLDRLNGWSRAAELVNAVIDRQRPFIERAEELAAERESEAPTAPKSRGTSASRW